LLQIRESDVKSFVSRTFLLGGAPVVCSFERPIADGNDFRCDYLITFPGRERRASGYGVDEVQALILAMERAHLDLLSAPERRDAKLLWLDMDYLGLPLPSGLDTADVIIR
jgi:hypothetical protein